MNSSLKNINMYINTLTNHGKTIFKKIISANIFNPNLMIKYGFYIGIKNVHY